MKKILLLFSLLVSMGVTAQVQVYETKTDVLYKSVMMNQELVKNTLGDNIHYAFYFKNSEYTHIVDIQSISFNSVTDVKDFFTIAYKAIEEKKEYVLSVGQETVLLKFKSGVVEIFTTHGWCWMNKRQIDELLVSLAE